MITPADNSSPAPATTEDAFLGGRLTLRQLREGSRAGLDAVFLAAACPVKPGQHVLDAGTGSGVVALAIARRIDGTQVTGIDVDAAVVRLAEENAARNGLAARARFLLGDVTAPASALTAAGLAFESFDHVVANPPFLAPDEARLSPCPRLRRAHTLEAGDLERWIRFLAAFCKPKGTATIVHRADALPRLLSFLERRFGGVIVYPLFPREGEPAVRVLVQGTKGSRAPFSLAPGIVLHGVNNAFTPAAEAVLREGAGIALGA